MSDRSFVPDEELVERARDVATHLERGAATFDRTGRLDIDAVDVLKSSGLLRIHQPVVFGGLEKTHRRLPLQIAHELARASGSVAWIQSVLSTHGWLLGCFPAPAQHAVWGDDQDAVVSTAFAAATGGATKVDGGFHVGGRWSFSSGCHLADWVVVRASVQEASDTRSMALLVPAKSVTIVDDWNPPGLRGTGSNSIDVVDAFVPEDFAVDLLSLRGSPTLGSALHQNPMYCTSFSAVFAYSVAVVGAALARVALECFRVGAIENKTRPPKASLQIRFAQNAAAVDAAWRTFASAGDTIADAEERDGVLSTHARVTLKRDYAFATVLASRAIEDLAPAIGARGLDRENAFQRAKCDLQSVGAHFGLSWDEAAEQYGRVAFGLDPTDPMQL